MFGVTEMMFTCFPGLIGCRPNQCSGVVRQEVLFNGIHLTKMWTCDSHLMYAARIASFLALDQK